MNNGSTVQIREMSEADIDVVSSIRVNGWKSAYVGIIPQAYLDKMSVEEDIQRRRAWFASSRGTVEDLIAVNEHGTPVGWICFGPYRGESEMRNPMEIYAFYVDPGLRSRGIGRTLLEATHNRVLAQELTTIYLWVLSENSRGRRFYEAAGYISDGIVRADMYDDHAVTEMRYARDLSPRS